VRICSIVSAEPAIDLIEPRVRAALATSGKRPFVVGLCGAQGSGKSTVSAGLKARFEASGLRVALLSLDDLYLPRQDRETLAASVHPLFRTRGVPGTHDTALGEALITACGREGMVALPSFSKEDDTRRPEAEWTRIATPVDVVLFEGWCVGAKPQREAALATPVNALEAGEDGDGIWRRRVNQRLSGDYQRLFACIDYLILLAAPGFGVVSSWRREQEHKLRAALVAEGKGLAATLDDAGVDRFIQYYQRLTEHILTEMTGRADLCILLDVERRPRLREPERV
jgi:D-glycerate 3-kinase